MDLRFIWKVSASFVLPELIFVGIAVFAARHYDNDGFLSLGVLGSGLYGFTFFGCVYAREASTEAALRAAIAAGIVTQYLVLVGLVSFFQGSDHAMAPITQTMLSNFTTVVGIVVAFYFGASAYLEARKHNPLAAETSKSAGEK
ncbi:hypothetical protein [Bradyrhizobium sp. Arg816]|uniref:hypothetical protein n=1 Tax=Bradyrhizobium sp. Arg816 TaxID=2998491 RepID=UPI00249E2B59|nr:hypothetical protein [Bradyrhizobium sp. Arg816]MDI3567231.1 hypothetical protein [Bradyrhizobium sp. Arg816]